MLLGTIIVAGRMFFFLFYFLSSRRGIVLYDDFLNVYVSAQCDGQ